MGASRSDFPNPIQLLNRLISEWKHTKLLQRSLKFALRLHRFENTCNVVYQSTVPGMKIVIQGILLHRGGEHYYMLKALILDNLCACKPVGNSAITSNRNTMIQFSRCSDIITCALARLLHVPLMDDYSGTVQRT